MSSTLPLFLDCDPGIDDALALAYLCCQDDVDVVGIAASGGNVATRQVVENTRRWLALAERSHIPVHAGHELPLAWQIRRQRRTNHWNTPTSHTVTPAAGTPSCREPPSQSVRCRPREAWVDAAHAHPGQLLGVVIGPATNLALALDIDPELPRLLKRIFIMGGAFNYRGNTRPTTEWNVTFDPESTSRVIAAFGSVHAHAHPEHLPVIAPIEATEAVEMTSQRFEHILDGALVHRKSMASGAEGNCPRRCGSTSNSTNPMGSATSPTFTTRSCSPAPSTGLESTPVRRPTRHRSDPAPAKGREQLRQWGTARPAHFPGRGRCGRRSMSNSRVHSHEAKPSPTGWGGGTGP